jgi:H+/Cl- antiporter ClcA
VPPHPPFIGAGRSGCVLAGCWPGAVGAAHAGRYAAEDAFEQCPIHWMWWPAIGGLVIGSAAGSFRQALGVGYDIIGACCRRRSRSRLLGILR